MQVQTMHFKSRAGEKLADQRLQQTLKKFAEDLSVHVLKPSLSLMTSKAPAMQQLSVVCVRLRI